MSYAESRGDPRATRAVIDLGAIESNTARVRELVGEDVEILAVIKADGYGHGAVKVARACERAGAAALGVALVEEGLELRRAGIRLPILVHCLAGEDEIDTILENDLMPTVASLEFARALSAKATGKPGGAAMHADVDTGMGRVGFAPESAAENIAKIAKLSGLRLDGVYTHFSTSEIEDDPWTLGQLGKLDAVIERLSALGVRPPRIHAANSGAVINYPRAHLTMVRPGLMLYGAYPHRDLEKKVELRPALRLETSIAFLKNIEAGTPLGYGRGFVAPGPMRIATANIGYADGYPWRLSNRSSALVRGKRAPIVGRVSMDQLLIDLSSVPDAALGDVVTLLGSDGAERIAAEDLAEWAGTIVYEILCAISKRTPRRYENE
jgi:alanine racemase